MTKVDIISGFLGSGKTTLIKRILKFINNREKVVVIENEFGRVGIDGEIIKGAGIDVVEINSGCICCTVVGQFSASIKRVIDEFMPDRIIIEPSGVGKLSEILSSCGEFLDNGSIELNAIITVVNPIKFEENKLYVKEYLEDQISHARAVFLSRTQRASKDLICKVKNEIKKINPHSIVVSIPWQEIEYDFLNDILNRDILKRTAKFKINSSCHHHDGPAFQTWEKETRRLFEIIEIEDILKKLYDESYGKIFRAKGIIPAKDEDWIQFDYVQGEYEIRRSPPIEKGKLCIIGRDMNVERLESLFN